MRPKCILSLCSWCPLRQNLPDIGSDCNSLDFGVFVYWLDKFCGLIKFCGMRERFNEYERAFEGYLADNRVGYSAVDQCRRGVFGGDKIKSFDFVVEVVRSCGESGKVFIAEVKGKKFKGTSLAKMTGMECWVGFDDVTGLTEWEKLLSAESAGGPVEAVFVFVYGFENFDVEDDGQLVYEFEGRKYLFYCVRLADYAEAMKVRSPGWETVTLGAGKFRELAMPLDKLLFGCENQQGVNPKF